MDQFMLWEALITNLIGLGVKEYKNVRLIMKDAGLDDETIAALTPKWDDLYNRVKAASGG